MSRPSSLGSSISDIRDAEPAGTGASTPSSGHHHQPTTPISAHPVAAAAAALASGAITPNGDIDYKKVKLQTSFSSSFADVFIDPRWMRFSYFLTLFLDNFLNIFFFFRLKQLWEESQVENERLRDRLRVTHEDLSKCKDQLDNAFQVVYVAISTLLRALP